MKELRNFGVLALWACLISSCGSGGQENCRYGTPQSIFRADPDEISNYQFSSEGQNSSETFLHTPTGRSVEIYQSGCDEISQEFRFSSQLPVHELLPDSLFILEAANCFWQFAALTEDPTLFTQYAQVLQTNAGEFPLDTDVKLDEHFFMAVQMLPVGEQSIVLVFMGSKPALE